MRTDCQIFLQAEGDQFMVVVNKVSVGHPSALSLPVDSHSEVGGWHITNVPFILVPNSTNCTSRFIAFPTKAFTAL